MLKRYLFVVLLIVAAPLSALSFDTKLVRYPHYHQGRVVFTYLGDIWTADENGQNVKRITANKARDVYPRFSPDGKWIAFSSDRNGNLDVFIVPAEGGIPRQLTFNTADDTVMGWSPDSRSVLFTSNRGEDFMGKLYTVGIDGQMERNAGPDMGIYGAYSPDGKKLVINRKGQVYWRKYYRGAYQTDVTVMDIEAKKFTDLTDFNGEDSWPMWSTDGFIYFVSDRDGNGLTNIWRVAESGGKAEKITAFKTGDVRFPTISGDGKVIVFEHDFGIMKLDVASRKVTPVKVDIEAETQDNLTEVRDFNSQVDEYNLAPSGHRIVFSIHGEVFTAPTEEGDLRQITNSAARDKNPYYSPDGKTIAYISDGSGREEIYLTAADGSGAAQKITDLDTLKFAISWSPNSREIAFTTSDDKLRVYNVESKQTAELTSSKYGNIGNPTWSPDGKWLAFNRADESRTNNVYLIPSAGGQEHKVTFDSTGGTSPQFSPDGRKLFFLRNDGVGGGGGGGGGRAGTQLFAITLERETRDPNDPPDDVSADATDANGDPAAQGPRRQGAQRNAPPREINIDWAGLKRRTRQVTNMPTGVFEFALTPDGRTVIFGSSEMAGLRNVPVIYSIGEDGKRLTRVTSAAAGGAADDTGGGGGGGGGGGIAGLTVTRDGRAVFFKEGPSVYTVALGGGGAAAAGATARGDLPRRRVNFVAKVKIDHPAEWAEMFDDAWRTMKYRFYDPKMHGFDWDAARAKYQPLVENVGDRQELLNIINEMIGELNASHTGAAPPPNRGGNGTGYLGVDFDPDDAAGRYKITKVYEGGPADKDWVKVAAGNYLIAIDGKPVKVGDNYWRLLNDRLNRKVEVTINDKPSEEGAWKARIEPVNQGAYRQLRYEDWVRTRRAEVDKLSNGRVGYLHIQSMDQPSLRRFEKELHEYRNKEALVIDERWNGGGNIEQELLAILVQREYQIWQPRGTEPTGRPFAGFFGPKVVLQNWRSASNSEMFPAGFRALGLGKVVGTPTMGAVIGTGSYSLIDGSTVRTPGVGVFLADAKRTNLENYGVQPDVMVDNTPEDNLAGRDHQLEVSVQELMKQLGQKGQVATKNQ